MPKKHLLLLLAILSIGLPFAAEGGNLGIQPSGIVLVPLQKQQFSISGYSENINWSVQPTAMGTITSTGLYTAPATSGVAFIYAQPAGTAYTFASVVYLSQAGITGITASGPTPTLSPSPVTTPTAPSGSTPTPVLAIGSAPTTTQAPSAPAMAPVTAISISISPVSISVQAGQSVLFKASVQGTSNTQVQWSLSPNLGTLVNGYYTAPASFANETQVTISATSLADTTKIATATVLLAQPVSTTPAPSPVNISIAQGATTLTAGQSAQFTALVTGTSNIGVTWSVTPNVGTISNGFYTAPASVTTQQTLTVTATSEAQPNKNATVSLILKPVSSTPAPTVSISLSPGSKSLDGGQSVTFTPTVSGTTNTAVTWSISPQVGTIANGVYQAPATIASQQSITVTATSVANSAKTAVATVSLIPVGLTVGPTSTSLEGAQTATFTATVSGATNTAVTWSVSPQVGTISNGVYQAPATIATQQTITVTATSVANSAKIATATITFIPEGLTVAPATASLNGGKTATFTANVSGATNSAVTWSVSPQVGTISNGVYQAPATIATQQTITITATSVANSAKTATATITLIPVAVTVGPASASLAAGKSATFSAWVTGSSNTAVSWTVPPGVGTVVSGVYPAPATVATAQTVKVVATSVADPTKSASATIALTVTAPTTSTPSTAITLPVEVMGANGTTATVSVTGPSGTSLPGQLTLWMQIHGLKYDTEASVQVNSSAWLMISTGNVS